MVVCRRAPHVRGRWSRWPSVPHNPRGRRGNGDVSSGYGCCDRQGNRACQRVENVAALVAHVQRRSSSPMPTAASYPKGRCVRVFKKMEEGTESLFNFKWVNHRESSCSAQGAWVQTLCQYAAGGKKWRKQKATDNPPRCAGASASSSPCGVVHQEPLLLLLLLLLLNLYIDDSCPLAAASPASC